MQTPQSLSLAVLILSDALRDRADGDEDALHVLATCREEIEWSRVALAAAVRERQVTS